METPRQIEIPEVWERCVISRLPERYSMVNFLRQGIFVEGQAVVTEDNTTELTITGIGRAKHEGTPKFKAELKRLLMTYPGVEVVFY